jgi:putative DNA primase/helicase
MSFDPKTPTIDRFLSELTNNDKDAIAQIESFMAATLRTVGNCQKFLHLLGSGYGKSTLFRLISGLVGEENTATSSIKSWNLINLKQGT